VRLAALRRFATIPIAALAAALIACGSTAPTRIDVHIGGAVIHAEVATTPAARAKGLGGRDSLADEAGMLFIFPTARQAAFWMKDMRFPLDFVWISADKRVVELTENVPPPPPGTADADLTFYKPAGQVQYVVEVNAGVIETAGIRVGDAVSFRPEVPLESAR
jgi:uncharacterized membrane protein (UPF0127 family)